MFGFRWIAAIVAVALVLIASGTLRLWWPVPPLPAVFKPIDPGSELSRLMFEASRASRADDHQKAVELYTQALAVEPGPNLISRDLHALRGNEYNYIDETENAYVDFDAAIGIHYYKMSDQAIRAFMGRGYAALNLRKYAQAKDDFDTVLKEISNDVPRSSTLAWRGAAWQGLGDRAHSVADYRAALALDPKNIRAREGLKSLGEPQQ